MRTKLNLEPTRKAVVTLAVVTGFAFLTCCGVGVFMMSRINTIKAELTQKEEQVSESLFSAGKVDQAQKRYHDALSQLHYLEKSVSTRAYIPTLLKQLEAMGKSVNLKVIGVIPIAAPPTVAPPPPPKAQGDQSAAATPPPKPVKPPYDGQRINILVRGNYSNALSFLYRLTTFPKILTVNSVQMGRAASVGNKPLPRGTLEITFNLTAFVLDTPTSVSGVKVGSQSQNGVSRQPSSILAADLAVGLPEKAIDLSMAVFPSWTWLTPTRSRYAT